MPVSDIFKFAKDNAGRKAGITVRGKNLLSDWIIDARSGVSSFDMLVVGDSNVAFSSGGDTVQGLIDGLETGFETLGLKIYGSPIWFAGLDTQRFYGKYAQAFTYWGATQANWGNSNPGGVAIIRSGKFDAADTEYAPFIADTTGGASDNFFFSGLYNPGATTTEEQYLKVNQDATPRPRNTAVGNDLSWGMNSSWPLIKEKITGRFIFLQSPLSSPGWAHFNIWEQGGAQSNVSFPTTVSLQGTLGYGVHERSLNANPSRTFEVKIGVTGSGITSPQANYLGKAGFLFFSLHSNSIGVCVHPVHTLGGINSTDTASKHAALYTYSSSGTTTTTNKKMKLFLEEVVKRQKSSNSKNLGRVCIFINLGRNLTAGANDDARTTNYINDTKTIIDYYRKTWTDLGYHQDTLCFVCTFSPVYVQDSANDYEIKSRKALMGRAGVFGQNVCIIDHAQNLNYSDYATGLLWDNPAAGGSALPDFHLSDTGYTTLGKRIVSNFVAAFKALVKKKK